LGTLVRHVPPTITPITPTAHERLWNQPHLVGDQPLFAISHHMVQPWPMSEGAPGPIAADLGLKVGDDARAIVKAPDLVAKYSIPCASLWASARFHPDGQQPIHLKPAWRNYFASAHSVVAAFRPLSPIATDSHHRSSAARRHGRRTLIPAEYLIHPANLCSGTAISPGISASAAC
jgi:hypothetical protein